MLAIHLVRRTNKQHAELKRKTGREVAGHYSDSPGISLRQQSQGVDAACASCKSSQAGCCDDMQLSTPCMWHRREPMQKARRASWRPLYCEELCSQHACLLASGYLANGLACSNCLHAINPMSMA